MIDNLPEPHVTQLDDVSYLLRNQNSRLFLKREDLQYMGTHKFRLAYGMVFDGTRSLSDFGGFIESSSGNTGLALAEITDWINKPLILHVGKNISERIRKKLNKYKHVALVEYDDLEDAYSEIITFTNSHPEFIHLDQYNNPSAVTEFRTMMEEIIKQANVNIDIAVMGVGTGATLCGMSSVLNNGLIIGCTIDDEVLTIPGWKNFKNAKIHNTVLRLNNHVNLWAKFTIEELIDNQKFLSEQLGHNINLSTTGNLLAAIRRGDMYNINIATVCTGIDKK